MILLQPAWLVLIIPLLVSLWYLKAPSRMMRIFRYLIVLFMLLAIAGICIRFPVRRGTIVVVADQSMSMPSDARARQQEAIDLLQAEMSAGDKLAVISFGEKVAVEHPPQIGKFAGFTAQTGSDASNLTDALNTAVSMVPEGEPARILILSDGRWTGADPVSAGARAAVRDINFDYRLMERPADRDLAVYRSDVPKSVAPGESFLLTFWIRSPMSQEIEYQLVRDSKVIASGQRTVSSGLTRLSFRDRALDSGTAQYRFSILGNPDDPVPENNTARILLGISGKKSLLCVTRTPETGLSQLLRSGGMEIHAAKPEFCRWGLEDLSNYSGVLIEDISAEQIGNAGMENIAAWVVKTGAGFMMTGGKNAYGPGGYFKSPLEAIMPVSMELRKEHRKLALAVVVAMDRSGSMATPVGMGKTKMDLANLACVQVLDMLTDMDELGVIAVDSSAHTVVDIASIKENKAYRNKILRIESMGGGIFIYEALSHAADMLTRATPQTKHIILFADAADSEEPGRYVELLEKCTQAGITVSVIGLGMPADTDAPLLADIAQKGQGRCFFTDNPEELPRLFAQDTFIVARSTFLEEPTPIKSTAGLKALTNREFTPTGTLGGYNLCYLRPNANLAAVTLDDYSAPIVAAWQAGIGRVLCYTGQANGPYTGQLAQWPDIGSFFGSLAGWTVGENSNPGPDMLLTQDVREGNCRITLYIDPQSEKQLLTDVPIVNTLYGIPGMIPQTRKASMRYDNADTLTLDIPITGSETALSTIEIPGRPAVTLPPVCLPYSPEYRPSDGHTGSTVLEQLAKITGGQERISLTEIWNDLPRRPQIIQLSPALLIAAILLLLAEVFERRTGLVSRAIHKTNSSIERETSPFVRIHSIYSKSAKTSKAAVSAPKKDESENSTEPASELLGVLSTARRSAQTRTDRK